MTQLTGHLLPDEMAIMATCGAVVFTGGTHLPALRRRQRRQRRPPINGRVHTCCSTSGRSDGRRCMKTARLASLTNTLTCCSPRELKGATFPCSATCWRSLRPIKSGNKSAFVLVVIVGGGVRPTIRVDVVQLFKHTTLLPLVGEKVQA